MDTDEDFFWKKPTEYHSFYNMRILGYVDLTFGVIMIISNMLVILVLATVARKDSMPPIRTIFVHLAISEVLTGFGYMPRAWHEFIRVTKCSIAEYRTPVWETISLYSYLAGFLFHHISVWFAVMLAVWRYVAVIHPFKERTWCNMEVTRKVIISGYVFGFLITIPPYFSIAVEPTIKLLDENGCSTSNFTIGKNVTIYEFRVPLENFPLLYVLVFGGYAVFLKTVPTILLAAISYKLITALIEAKESRKKLGITSAHNIMEKNTNQTTRILLVIMISFLLGEVPHGIGALITVYNGRIFFWKFYYYAMEIFNCVTSITESLNFVVYYLMSAHFRDCFKALFHRDKNPLLSLGTSTENEQSNNSNRKTSTETIVYNTHM